MEWGWSKKFIKREIYISIHLKIKKNEKRKKKKEERVS